MIKNKERIHLLAVSIEMQNRDSVQNLTQEFLAKFDARVFFGKIIFQSATNQYRPAWSLLSQ